MQSLTVTEQPILEGRRRPQAARGADDLLALVVLEDADAAAELQPLGLCHQAVMQGFMIRKAGAGFGTGASRGGMRGLVGVIIGGIVGGVDVLMLVMTAPQMDERGRLGAVEYGCGRHFSSLGES